ncbi:MAG: NADH-quinone oxidoreductase subunit H [Candidatus Bipolaricaulota bacterium]|nr:NADH-quinone oxidoreductase subunit H [Candidatus Bipolaricaulota bacterium]MDW8152300.1 complex I subunit 1 family protein [Candidatus Bipolaricaulota bacterium]
MSGWAILGQAVLALVGGGIVGLLYRGLDRKIAARMQARLGPPLRQPFLDLGKLLAKETVIPKTAVAWVFSAMPFVAAIASFTALLYLPWGPFGPILEGHGDALLVLYLLAVPALAMALGGFASGSPLGVVGAQRELVMLVSYEFPLAVVLVALAWRLSTLGIAPAFSLGQMARYPLWGVVGPLGLIGLVVLLVSLLVVTPAELAKIPFDIPEAETEIAGGLFVEYSGTYLALFYLADAVRTVVMAGLVVALFVPYGIAQPLGLAGAAAQAVDLLFWLAKVFGVMAAAVTTVRVGMARLKVDQIARGFWWRVTAVALSGLLLLALDKVVSG